MPTGPHRGVDLKVTNPTAPQLVTFVRAPMPCTVHPGCRLELKGNAPPPLRRHPHARDARLAEAGTDKSKLLWTQIWLSDISERDAMNEVWTSWIDVDNPPVRACVQAQLARSDLRIEIMVIAALE